MGGGREGLGKETERKEKKHGRYEWRKIEEGVWTVRGWKGRGKWLKNKGEEGTLR